jgi:hypothetical protein
MLRKYAKLIIKIIVSAFFLFWVIFKVDWNGVIKSIQEISLFYLAVYVAIIILGMIISAYKWKLLSNFKEINLRLSDFFKYYLAGTFINNFMPSFIGGDTFKAYETGKPQGKYVEAASSVVMDRITGLFGATILALIFSMINIKNVINNKILLTVNLILLLFFIFDIAVVKIKGYSFWGRFKKYFPDKIVAFIIDLGTYNKNSGVIRKSIFLSFAFNFIGIALANYILFLALGTSIDWISYLSVIFIISIISSVPVSINNIGIKEWSYITFLGVFGVSSSLAVTVSLISRFIQMLISFFALPVYLKRKK